MFLINTPLLLMSVRAGHTMINTNGLEIFVEITIFTTPIRLDTFNFGVEEAFNHSLKL
jgi:hypothetical protein